MASAVSVREGDLKPLKFHEPPSQRVPKASYRLTNWSEYDRGLLGGRKHPAEPAVMDVDLVTAIRRR